MLTVHRNSKHWVLVENFVNFLCLSVFECFINRSVKEEFTEEYCSETLPYSVLFMFICNSCLVRPAAQLLYLPVI